MRRIVLPCWFFLSLLAVLCFFGACGKVDKKRSIALPVKGVKKKKEGPSYLTKLRVVNAKEYTLACTLCVDYATLVKDTLSKSKEHYDTTVGWRMDDRKTVNYHTSDSHLLDIFDDQRVCNLYAPKKQTRQCSEKDSFLCMDVPTESEFWVGTLKKTCQVFMELEEDSLTSFVRSELVHQTNGAFEYCRSLNVCSGRPPPVVKKKKVKKKKKKKKTTTTAKSKRKKKKKKKKKKGKGEKGKSKKKTPAGRTGL